MEKCRLPTFGVDLQVTFADCLEDAVQGTIAVVVQKHGHSANPIQLRQVIFVTAHIVMLLSSPRNDVLHIAYMRPRQPEDKAVDALVVGIMAATCAQRSRACSKRNPAGRLYAYTVSGPSSTEDHTTKIFS